MRSVHAVILSLLLLSLSACALLPNRDPLNINVVGFEPLQSQDMEVRFAVKIRVQNPNETAIDYNGVALDLEVNGQPLASGVSDQSGSIARFSETVLTVPVSVSAFSVLRQTLGLSQTQTLEQPALRPARQTRGRLVRHHAFRGQWQTQPANVDDRHLVRPADHHVQRACSGRRSDDGDGTFNALVAWTTAIASKLAPTGVMR